MSTCWWMNPQERRATAQAVIASLTGEDDEEAYKEEAEQFMSEEDQEEEPIVKSSMKFDNNVTKYNKTVSNYSDLSVPSNCLIKTAKVFLYPDNYPDNKQLNVYDSPILAALHGTTTAYIVLDSGATTSLANLAKIQQLSLKIVPTKHRAVQIDGESMLSVVGEVHTTFTRSDATLTFSALVVENLSTDFLGGTNFLVENDITIRMAKNTIKIRDNKTIISATPTVLKLDKLDTKHRLVSIAA